MSFRRVCANVEVIQGLGSAESGHLSSFCGTVPKFDCQSRRVFPLVKIMMTGCDRGFQRCNVRVQAFFGRGGQRKENKSRGNLTLNESTMTRAYIQLLCVCVITHSLVLHGLRTKSR